MSTAPPPARPSRSPQRSASESPVVHSALWAAWGDAIGFPAELADSSMLQRRLEELRDGDASWPRRVGGRMGPTVGLPAGTVSDDTQLRLAVGRCVRGSGRFDVEAFSKIELPVFLSYELGAGRGTKVAAGALGRRSTRWFSNFFDARGQRYVDGGGNGAAMRVQPHVWAAHGGAPDAYLRPLLRDAVCTHGHPRGLLGAALHALALATTLTDGAVPSPGRWVAMAQYLRRVPELIAEDEVLATRWLPLWEQEADGPFAKVCQQVIGELSSLLQRAERAAHMATTGDRSHVYERLARDLGGTQASVRGAGSLTAVLALWLAWVFQDDPASGVQASATLLGSDTDTIGTMAGALLGAVAGGRPPGPVQDEALVVREAQRLDGLRLGEAAPSFPHPDTVRWQPPKTLTDSLGLLDGEPQLAGLGPVELLGEPMAGQGRQPGLWQWTRTDYGQTLLVKRRERLSDLAEGSRQRHRPAPTSPRPDEPDQREVAGLSPEQAMDRLRAADMDDRVAGELLRALAGVDALSAAVFATLLSAELVRRPDRQPGG